jgi:hypothetical protein
MTLSLSSVLHYWTSRSESATPIVGGKPVHSRNSAGGWIDGQGIRQSAIVNTPRFEQADLGDGAGRRAVMTLEIARTNQMLWSNDFSNAVWGKSSCSVTTGIASPDGNATACTVTATGVSAQITQNLGAGSSIVRANSMWMRRRTGSGLVQLLMADTGGVTVALTSAWQRFSAIEAAAGTGQFIGVYIQTSGDAVDLWLAQEENTPTISSGIATTSVSVARSADLFYWAFPPMEQAMMIYLRMRDTGAFLQGGGARYLAMFGATTLTYICPVGVPGNAIRCYWDDGTNTRLSDSNGVSVLPGDTLEVALVLSPSGVIQSIASVNGAAVIVGAVSAALTIPSTIPTPVLILGDENTHIATMASYAEVKAVKYADVVGATPADIMAELRAFELGANGQVL